MLWYNVSRIILAAEQLLVASLAWRRRSVGQASRFTNREEEDLHRRSCFSSAEGLRITPDITPDLCWWSLLMTTPEDQSCWSLLRISPDQSWSVLTTPDLSWGSLLRITPEDLYSLKLWNVPEVTLRHVVMFGNHCNGLNSGWRVY